MSLITREPDYISPNTGVYFWFSEMMYYSSPTGWQPMFLDTTVSKLRIKDYVVCRRCERCTAKLPCERAYLREHVQEAYRAWEFKLIERTIIESASDCAENR